MAEKKRGLGRGIDAFFQDSKALEEQTEEDRVENLPVGDIRANPYQPRLTFDTEALEELADSIRENGVLQPIIVRKSEIKGYEVIAGERRLRASKIAEKDTIPAIVRDLNDEKMIEVAILENLQREDLTPLEEAQAYQTMLEKLDLTQDAVAKRLGKSRSYIANALRILRLPDVVKDQLHNEELSMGQARTLVSLKDKNQIIALAKRAVEEELTVRQLEKEVARLRTEEKPQEKPKKEPVRKPLYITESEEHLIDKFGTDVAIRTRKSGEGKIEIEYTSLDDLTRILDILQIKLD